MQVTAAQAVMWPASHNSHSLPSPCAQVVFLLSPYHASPRFNMTAFAGLLWHHASWHAALGVPSYLLYADWGLTELLREPLVQALVKQGRLQVRGECQW